MRTQLAPPLAGALLGGLLLSGCGDGGGSAIGGFAAAPADALVSRELPTLAESSAAGAVRGVSNDTSVAPHVDADRKIIYTANIELAVEDFAGVSERVATLVREYGGYLAGSNLSGSTGESRRGTWTVRVPVEKYAAFIKSAEGLGEVIRVATDSRDVSEEYVDVDARIRNKTKEEERLLKLLEERPGKLEDVIAIERELSRVREELERMQGRMRVLHDLTSLTTIELTISEIRNYQPPQAPTLATQVRRTWTGSLSALKSTAETALLGVVAVAPWIPLLAIAIVSPVILVRRRLRGTHARP